jgi:hypothetical protein
VERRLQLFLPQANPGNLIFRYMFAHYLRESIPYAVLTGASIPELGVTLPISTRPRNPYLLPYVQEMDIESIMMATLKDSSIDGIELHCWAQRLEYFEEKRDKFSAMFTSSTGGQVIYPDEILVSVRAGEILHAIHPHYWPVPISYLRRVIAQSGLRPVFSGQTRPSWYADALRAAFPDARFLAGNHWLDDFQTLRNAENIVLSVGTFAWTAAWLSTTAKRIYMPLLGFLNRDQCPDVDLYPKHDDRYVVERFIPERYLATPEQIRRIVE